MIPDNDPWRIALPTAQFAFYTLSPVLYLFGLATAPTTYISTKWKQAISLPLLISSIVCPYIYKDIGNGKIISKVL
jgi:hypothetical protein